jgi:hypothetical protein
MLAGIENMRLIYKTPLERRQHPRELCILNVAAGLRKDGKFQFQKTRLQHEFTTGFKKLLCHDITIMVIQPLSGPTSLMFLRYSGFIFCRYYPKYELLMSPGNYFIKWRQAHTVTTNNKASLEVMTSSTGTMVPFTATNISNVSALLDLPPRRRLSL